MENPVHGTPDEWFSWLAGSDAAKRNEATLILGGLTPYDAVAVDPLIARLADASDDIVFWAVVALSCLEHRSERAVPELTRLSTTHPAFGIRQAALEALPRVSPRDPAAKRAILYALGDDSHWVRQSALRALIGVQDLDDDDLRAIRALESDPEVSHQLEVTLRNIRLRDKFTNDA